MTAAATRISVPGKLILMGEHAAVYGGPALVTAIGLRMRIRLRPCAEAGVRLELPDLGADVHIGWPEIEAVARDARLRWREFAEAPSPATFAWLRPDGPEDLVALALGETGLALGEPGGPPAGASPGLEVRIESEIPVGSGFGSSAAVAVGVVTAWLATRGVGHGWADVDPIAFEVERRQHGLPSGVDSATVFHGGVLSCRRVGDRIEVEPLAADPGRLRRVRVFDTGVPAESTGAVVADVRARRDRDPAAFEAGLATMSAATERLRSALLAGGESCAPLIEPIRAYQAELEALGVVPRRVREVVRAVESAGGAAKISGAGALSGEGAGSLIVVLAEADDPPELADLTPLDVPLGVEGARLESVA